MLLILESLIIWNTSLDNGILTFLCILQATMKEFEKRRLTLRSTVFKRCRVRKFCIHEPLRDKTNDLGFTRGFTP